jgi:hypothetical protein
MSAKNSNKYCLLCSKPGNTLGPDIDFICSGCVILLADTDRESLKRAYQKAQNEGYLRKVSALESFLLEETINARKAKNPKFRMVRTRPLRTARPTRY